MNKFWIFFFLTYWILSLNAQPVIVVKWDKAYGGNADDVVETIPLVLDGGYIIAGLSESDVSGNKACVNQGNDDFYIVKIDSNGAIQWDKSFGGKGSDLLTDIKQTKDGGYILVGFSNSGIGGDKTQDNWDITYLASDCWIVKIDSSGNKQWDKRYGGKNPDNARSVIEASDGGFIIACTTSSDSGLDVSQSSEGGYNYWVLRLNADGTKKWDKRYGIGEVKTILKTADEGFILAGSTNHYRIVKVDSNGSKQWEKTYAGNDMDDLKSIFITSDGGYLLCGNSSSNQGGDKSEDNLGSYQPWLVKTDSLGNKQWDKTIFTTGFDYTTGAVQNSDGCYVVASSSYAGVGGYKTQPNWDSTEVTYDYWVIKFCDTLITGINEVSTGAQLTISPNPFTTDIAIALRKDGMREAMFTITNTLGQPVYTRKETNLSSSYTKMLDLSYLPTGMYFVEVMIDGERIVRQVVKQ